ncbi:MAG TPA: LPS assembly protein LptD [Alphaproteobacteria bacterium]|nr:LPS assembly protein LptD [Alphaproteobacteria bacterium]
MWRGGLIAGLVALLGAMPAAAQNIKVDRATPVLITADEVNYERDNSTVVARGHVEVSQGPRVLKADQVVYNQTTKVVVATGHVSVLEPGGEVLFADRMEVKDDLKEGVIQNFAALFPDDSRLAASAAVRTEGNRTVMKKAVFSPCKLCEDNPRRAPLWQVRAREVIHDQEAQDIEYRDAWLEIFGVPVAYTPYLTHPDPTVKRRTGLLPPIVGKDSNLGAFVKQPYFITLGPDKDLTLVPMVTTEERGQLSAEYRQRLLNGAFAAQGSFTRVKRKDADGNDLASEQNRGHILATGRYDIDDTWRAGFKGGWVTDDTYFRRYRIDPELQLAGSSVQERQLTSAISPDQSLTSTGFVEGFSGRQYASLRAYHFQGLRQDDDDNKTPLVAPYANYNVVSEPLGRWGRWTLDSNLMALTRVEGADSRRLSLRTGWELPRTNGLGQIFTFGTSLQTDLYDVNAVPTDPSDPGSKFSGITGRAFPQASIDWRWPFVRELGNVRHVVEPRVALIAAPSFGNTGRIPNEDSQDFEFDDTNLFSYNRFAGIDRVDTGSRLIYGLENAFYGDGGGRTEIFLGGSYSPKRNDDFPDGSGVEEKLSDLVGRIRLEPADYLSMLYRFRLSTETLKAKRSEVTTRLGPEAINLGANYVFFDDTTTTKEFGTREELTLALRSRVTENWSLLGRYRYNFAPFGTPIEFGGAVTYQDECFLLTTDFSRSFTSDRDVKASTRVVMRLVFKHLGDFSTNVK